MTGSSFAAHKYEIVAAALSAEAAALCARYAQLKRLDPEYFKAESMPSCAHGRYADAMGESLLLSLQPQIEAVSGISLFPSYSYLRFYETGAELPRHLDRPSCEVSATLTLGFDADQDWPIWVEVEGEDRAQNLAPGDLMVYDGVHVPHWREAFTGRWWLQLFLHYVDQNGEQTAHRFDGREAIGMPRTHPRDPPKPPSRNDPCPCGSGKRYKHCHGTA